MFYYAKDWMYNSLYNETSLYSNYFIHQDYIQILDVSNNLWLIRFNQTNNFITNSFQYSSDKKDWKEIQDCILSTDYINITANFKNTNGKTIMLVTSTTLDLSIEENLESNTCNFPLWCPIENTSILENNSIIEIKMITFNGTIAGITRDLFRIVLIKNETILISNTKLNNRYVWGTELTISATLTCVHGNQILYGEIISFTIIEIYPNKEIIEINLMIVFAKIVAQ